MYSLGLSLEMNSVWVTIRTSSGLINWNRNTIQLPFGVAEGTQCRENDETRHARGTWPPLSCYVTTAYYERTRISNYSTVSVRAGSYYLSVSVRACASSTTCRQFLCEHVHHQLLVSSVRARASSSTTRQFLCEHVHPQSQGPLCLALKSITASIIPDILLSL